MNELVQTPIGRLPKQWTIKSLVETTTKIQDGTHFSPQSKDGPRLYVTSKNIKFGRLDLSDCERISQKEHDAIYVRCDVRLGDVLLTKDGANTGNACLNTLNEPFSLLSSVAFLRTDEAVTHGGFILQYLLSPIGQRRLKDLMSGNAIPRLTLEKIKAFKTPVPPLPTQQRIARILQTVDRAMEKTEALIEKNQQIKAGLMHDRFTRGLWTQEELDRGDHQGTPAESTAKVGQLRPSRQDAPHIYQETTIGWIPKTWGVVELGQVAEICSGVTLGTKATSERNLSVPYLRVANVQDGYLDLSEVKEIPVSEGVLRKLRLQSGDVLMNEGGDFDKLGRGTVWEGEIDPCIHQNHVFRVRVNKSKVIPYFLAFWSQSNFGKKYFILSSKQSTNLASINSSQLHRFPIASPTTSEQFRIEERIEAVNRRIRTLSNELNKLQEQKAGLMHDLLTGKVPVILDSEEPADA